MSILKSLFNSNLLASIATLLSGSVVAQLITLFASPLMTRLYTEEQIGEYTLFLTAVSMFGTVLCGRYDQPIISEADDRKAHVLVKLCFFITLAMSVLVGIGYSVYYRCSGNLHFSIWETFFWLFLLLLLTGIGHILTSYNNRYRQYKLMASTHVARTVGKEVSMVGLGAAHLGATGLLISQVLSVGIGLTSQAKGLRANKGKLRQISRKEMAAVARQHIKQPLFSVPASFANSYSYSVLNLFVSNLFGNVALAHYSLSFRLLGLPLNLISANASKAFFEKASREYDKTGNFRRTFLQTSLLLAAVAVPMVILLLLLAPWAFAVFFGEGWEQAGSYVQYLAPLFGVRLVVSALTPTMTICKKQNFELLLQLLFVVAIYLVRCFCHSGATMEQFLTGISVCFTVIYILFYLVMLKLSCTKQKGESDIG